MPLRDFYSDEQRWGQRESKSVHTKVQYFTLVQQLWEWYTENTIKVHNKSETIFLGRWIAITLGSENNSHEDAV